MKIQRTMVPESTLEAFADAHGLVMEINERSSEYLPRFTARFEGAELGGDGILRGAYGSGDTEAMAMADYARQISLMTLVIDAYHETRREIRVPRLIGVEKVAGAELTR